MSPVLKWAAPGKAFDWRQGRLRLRSSRPARPTIRWHTPSMSPPSWARRRSGCSAICAIRASIPDDIAGADSTGWPILQRPPTSPSRWRTSRSATTPGRRARALLRRPAGDVAAVCGRWSTSATAGSWTSRPPMTQIAAARAEGRPDPSQGQRLRRQPHGTGRATARCRGPSELEPPAAAASSAPEVDGEHGDPLPSRTAAMPQPSQWLP